MSSAEAVLLVADAGDDTGLGHVARSSALAQALGERGITIECVGYRAPEIRTRDGVEWRPQASAHQIVELAGHDRVVVLDSYRMPTASVDAIASTARLAIMLDFGEPPPAAALAIAPGLPSDDRPGMLAGLRYACLSPAFRDLPARDPAAIVEQVLVTTGGGDPGGRAAELAAAAAAALPDARVQLLQGAQAEVKSPPTVELVAPFEAMAGALAETDLIVCGAGGTLVEACAAGVPALGVVLAANQAPLAAALLRAGAVSLLDDGDDPEAAIETLGRDLARRTAQSQAARAAVDGRGAERVAAQIERLISR